MGLVLAVVCAVGLLGGYRLTSVVSDSMAPSYGVGDSVLYERVGGGGLRRGDVVLFSMPGRHGEGVLVMQRVIGVGGDRVVCCTGVGAEEAVSVNGRVLAEPYVFDGIAHGVGAPYDVRVPEGRLFLLGDRRETANDSRFHAGDHGGTVPVGAVEGRVVDDSGRAVLLAVGTVVGAGALLVGAGVGIAAEVGRRRRGEAGVVARGVV
ncbi:signal peptidase I [Streptomyces sp. NPDC088789]|uniref:signal peptidase I n=1 Tax=Streptomyces sp. NPDC088789 TaxID=3365899 RepID=UPI00380A21DB